MGKKNGSNLGESRETFGSSFGLLAAAVGSAVGLGNIWRFPTITGQNGGAAFLIVYLAMVAVIGVPIMIVEFTIGREARKDAIGSFRKLAPGKPWFASGVLGVLAAFFILAFYGVIAGWTLEYIVKAVTNSFAGQSPDQISNMFTSFIASPIKPIIWQVIFMTITGLVVSIGVQDGIEKLAKVLIPLLLLIIIILDVQALLLPGGKAGLEFLFKPDFSKLTRGTILAALGHAFFSLSLGMGIMITYGSYIDDKENLGSMAVKISIADTLIALLAGIAIFPAVFAFGIEPSSGAGLVFMALPNVFDQMAGGYIFGILFFSLLAVAALTSTMSLLEAVVAFVVDSFKVERRKATIGTTIAITLVGMIASLSNGVLSHIEIGGDNIFDFLDNTTANYFLTFAALISVVFLAWSLDKEVVKRQLTNDGTIKAGYIDLFYLIVKFVAPVAIVIVFLFQIGKI